jgi:hypothetical protein
MIEKKIKNFFNKVDKNGQNGCWLWIGCISNGGYGAFYGINRKVEPAHRFYYNIVNGEVPKSLDLDHLCRVRNCVNPEHLEPVTRSINLLRGKNWHRDRKHCKNGHEWTTENTYKSKTQRVCKICQKAKMERFKANKNVKTNS